MKLSVSEGCAPQELSNGKKQIVIKSQLSTFNTYSMWKCMFFRVKEVADAKYKNQHPQEKLKPLR